MADGGRYDHVLVLTGNLHARKLAVTRGGFTFIPMAAQLASAGGVTSLNMKDAGGTGWNCLDKPSVAVETAKPIGAHAIECGSHSLRSSSDLHRPPFMGLGEAPGSDHDHDPDYDGYFWVGRISASPPLTAAAPVGRR